jgi:hypothetical protein
MCRPRRVVIRSFKWHNCAVAADTLSRAIDTRKLSVQMVEGPVFFDNEDDVIDPLSGKAQLFRTRRWIARRVTLRRRCGGLTRRFGRRGDGSICGVASGCDDHHHTKRGERSVREPARQASPRPSIRCDWRAVGTGWLVHHGGRSLQRVLRSCCSAEARRRSSSPLLQHITMKESPWQTCARAARRDGHPGWHPAAPPSALRFIGSGLVEDPL